jgi:hypothetical protein
VLGQLGTQRRLDHPTGELRHQPARPRYLLLPTAVLCARAPSIFWGVAPRYYDIRCLVLNERIGPRIQRFGAVPYSLFPTYHRASSR